MTETPILVNVRLQPPPTNAMERLNDQELQLGQHLFRFDHIFDFSDTQQTVFEKVGAGLVNNCLTGYNGCLFVYGQTGSGKTYTMSGSGRCRGMMQHSFDFLLAKLEEMAAQRVVACSFVEIYNYQIYDLLDEGTSHKKLAIRYDIRKGVFLDGVCEENAKDSDHLVKIMERGLAGRHVGYTMMNKESSRSHAIFTLNVQLKLISKEGTPYVRSSKLHFVDLAGSEKQKSTLAAGYRLKYASNINKSLGVFGQVINSLSTKQGKPAHVPYRDSKLTFLLRDSLGGNSKTTIIATVSSSPQAFQYTLSTLKFAYRAKFIKSKVYINYYSLSGNVDVLRREVKCLRYQLQIADYKLKNMVVEVPGCNHLEQIYQMKVRTEHAIMTFLHTLEYASMDKTLNTLPELVALRQHLQNLIVSPHKQKCYYPQVEMILQQNIALRSKVKQLYTNIETEHSRSELNRANRFRYIETLTNKLQMIYSDYATLEYTLQFQKIHHQQTLDNLNLQLDTVHYALNKITQYYEQRVREILNYSSRKDEYYKQQLAEFTDQNRKMKQLYYYVEEYEEAHQFLKQYLSKMVGSRKSLSKSYTTCKDRLKLVIYECRNKDNIINELKAQIQENYNYLKSELEAKDRLFRYNYDQLANLTIQIDKYNETTEQYKASLSRQLESLSKERENAQKYLNNAKYKIQKQQIEISSMTADFSTIEMKYENRIVELESMVGYYVRKCSDYEYKMQYRPSDAQIYQQNEYRIENMTIKIIEQQNTISTLKETNNHLSESLRELTVSHYRYYKSYKKTIHTLEYMLRSSKANLTLAEVDVKFYRQQKMEGFYPKIRQYVQQRYDELQSAHKNLQQQWEKLCFQNDKLQLYLERQSERRASCQYPQMTADKTAMDTITTYETALEELAGWAHEATNVIVYPLGSAGRSIIDRVQRLLDHPIGSVMKCDDVETYKKSKYHIEVEYP